MKSCDGPRPLASGFVNPATLATEIPVLKAGSQDHYNGRSTCAESLANEYREGRFEWFQIPAERRRSNGARESTVDGNTKFANAIANKQTIY